MVVVSTFSAPSEGVLYQQTGTKLIVNDKELGTGNLYITESNVVWGGGELATGGSAPTISLLYPTISLHAIQREPSAALYMVVNFDLRLPELGNVANENEDEEFDPEDTPITQLRFIPPNEGELQPMYVAMNQGQSLHPDPQDEVDIDDFNFGEEFEDEEEFEDAEESEQPDDAAAGMGHLNIHNSNGNHNPDENGGDAELE